MPIQDSTLTAASTCGEPFEGRCHKAAELAAGLGVAQLIASDPATVLWLTGRTHEIEYGPLYPFSAGTLVVLQRDGSGSIICPAEDCAGGPAIPGFTLRPYEAYSLARLQPFRNAALTLGINGPVAVEAHALAVELVGDHPWIDAADELRSLRLVKDSEELRILRHAATIVSAGQRAFREAAEPGLTEIQLFSHVHAAMEQAAGRRVPVLVDLMSGERLIEVGRPPTDRAIRDGELVLCDLLARIDGYWADSCTTISVGRADHAARDLHDACLRALSAGIEASKPGVLSGDLDTLMRNVLNEAGYTCPHHTGHGVGVSFHEEPRIVPGASLRLEPGMVMALEPAAFTNRLGARVEHTLEIAEGGARVLTDYNLALDQETS